VITDREVRRILPRTWVALAAHACEIGFPFRLGEGSHPAELRPISAMISRVFQSDEPEPRCNSRPRVSGKNITPRIIKA
jgi:hypothetical protein